MRNHSKTEYTNFAYTFYHNVKISKNTMAMINGNENSKLFIKCKRHIKHKDACSQSEKSSILMNMRMQISMPNANYIVCLRKIRINLSYNIFKAIKNYYIAALAAAMQARNNQSN
ncbi:hypothetical protein T10_12232 [Trichinella papuae]|uniref:Uncharacterized protein n=1 Tax=Trichinella papuae TaxID=268474 RepID=A0A0V1N4Y3_9BILA|nr:hypothetical protein T10_12232 [Trichinella papuae]